MVVSTIIPLLYRQQTIHYEDASTSEETIAHDPLINIYSSRDHRINTACRTYVRTITHAHVLTPHICLNHHDQTEHA